MNDVTLHLLDEVLRKELISAKDLKDDDVKCGKMRDICYLAEQLNSAEESRIKEIEMRNRREIELERIRSTVLIEATKKRPSIGQAALELVKVGVPAAISALSLLVYRKSFKEMGHFEETGHYTSNMSRELHLPKILK